MTDNAAIARPSTILRNEDYAALGQSGDAFADALALIEDRFGGEVVDATDLGDGFTVLDKAAKKSLIGVPFVILSVTFHEGDYIDETTGAKGEFASLRLVTKDGRKIVLNDGGTGIPDQIRTLHKMKPDLATKPILVHKGLRVSEYEHPKHGKSETFYLDTSAP